MSAKSGLKLNLGCGLRHKPGYINVDMYGEPDVRHDLESFPWPWDDDTVSEILLVHVLEHLGHSPRVYRDIWKEMYRICLPDAKLHIVVPHFRHEAFFADPTHVRAITPLGLSLLSQRHNISWAKQGAANSPLGMYWDVDFNMVSFTYKPSADWFRLHPDRKGDSKLLLEESTVMNNLIEEISFEVRVVKPTTSQRNKDKENKDQETAATEVKEPERKAE